MKKYTFKILLLVVVFFSINNANAYGVSYGYGISSNNKNQCSSIAKKALVDSGYKQVKITAFNIVGIKGKITTYVFCGMNEAGVRSPVFISMSENYNAQSGSENAKVQGNFNKMIKMK